MPGTDVSTEWLEGHLQEFVQSLCDEWGTALPLVQARRLAVGIRCPPTRDDAVVASLSDVLWFLQVWLPRKSTTGAATIFLSTEDCPYVIADPAMSAFRKRRCVAFSDSRLRTARARGPPLCGVPLCPARRMRRRNPVMLPAALV